MRALPGVAAVGMASVRAVRRFPRGIRRSSASAAGSQAQRASKRPIASSARDYFRSLNLPMVRGREFTEAEEDSPTAPRVAIIDERLARKLFGADDPIGQMIRFAERPGEITQERRRADGRSSASRRRSATSCSTARPARRSTSRGDATTAATCSCTSAPARAGTESDLLATIRRELRAYDPRLPVLQATTMQAFHDQSIALWAVQRRRPPVPRLRRARAAARRGRALRREVVPRARSARARSGSGWRSARVRATCSDGAERRRRRWPRSGSRSALPLAALLGVAAEQPALRRQAARSGRLPDRARRAGRRRARRDLVPARRATRVTP